MMRSFFIALCCMILLMHYPANAKDYKFYYRQTAFAEECLRNGQFELSLKHFDSAFNDQRYKFPKDCYIAAQIAAYLKEDKKTSTYLEYAMRAGVSYDYFKPQLHTAMLNGYIHPYELLFIYAFNKNNLSKATPKDIDGYYNFTSDTSQVLHFNTTWEKRSSDSEAILKNRYEWYIPRPGKYNADELLKLYGIDIEVGDFIF